jgi:predicted enzyme related to lactoylglutathione lyase
VHLGGKVVVAVTEVPQYNLRFANFTDPESHVVGLSNGMAQS